MTFLLIDRTRHWIRISNLFLKNIKVKGRQRPAYRSEVNSENEGKVKSEVELKVDPDVELDVKSHINLGIYAAVEVKM